MNNPKHNLRIGSLFPLFLVDKNGHVLEMCTGTDQKWQTWIYYDSDIPDYVELSGPSLDKFLRQLWTSVD
jgi:hypothetical protein